jgi:hypothetical protein
MPQTRVLVAPNPAAGEAGREALVELIADLAGHVVSISGSAAAPKRAVLVLPDDATAEALRRRYVDRLTIESDAALDIT